MESVLVTVVASLMTGLSLVEKICSSEPPRRMASAGAVR